MRMVQRQETNLKACFDPPIIEGLLHRIDTDPTIAPKGLAQIEFYTALINTLRYNGELMEVTVTREVPATDQPEVPLNGQPVWTSEDVDPAVMEAADNLMQEPTDMGDPSCGCGDADYVNN